MIVVDTNVIAYLYLEGEKSRHVERLLSVDSHWCAPVLWRSEFRSVLSLYLRKGYLSIDEVLLIIDQADKLLIDNEYELPAVHVMRLVNSSRCSAYDCEFVVLAQRLDAPLVTLDRAVLRAFPECAMTPSSFATEK